MTSFFQQRSMLTLSFPGVETTMSRSIWLCNILGRNLVNMIFVKYILTYMSFNQLSRYHFYLRNLRYYLSLFTCFSFFLEIDSLCSRSISHVLLKIGIFFIQIRGMHTLIRDGHTTKHDFVFYADRLIRLVSTLLYWLSYFSQPVNESESFFSLSTRFIFIWTRLLNMV